MAKDRGKRRPSHSSPQRKDRPSRPVLPGAERSTERICWRFEYVDHDGPWGFGEVQPKTLGWLLGRLSALERMTVNEVFHRGDYPGKDYNVADIPTSKALARLEAIGLGDMTKIWVLRLQGQPRLYGFLVENVFHVVWWDPLHEIWPPCKRNT